MAKKYLLSAISFMFLISFRLLWKMSNMLLPDKYRLPHLYTILHNWLIHNTSLHSYRHTVSIQHLLIWWIYCIVQSIHMDTNSAPISIFLAYYISNEKERKAKTLLDWKTYHIYVWVIEFYGCSLLRNECSFLRYILRHIRWILIFSSSFQYFSKYLLL